MLKHADLFPAVRHAISIALTLPVTTYTADRSFSNLRRVKTWLQSMWDERLVRLVYDERSPWKNQQRWARLYIERVVNRFARDPGRLQLLFLSDADKYC